VDIRTPLHRHHAFGTRALEATPERFCAWILPTAAKPSVRLLYYYTLYCSSRLCSGIPLTWAWTGIVMVANNQGAAASPTHSSVEYLSRLTNTVYLTVLISTSTMIGSLLQGSTLQKRKEGLSEKIRCRRFLLQTRLNVDLMDCIDKP